MPTFRDGESKVTADVGEFYFAIGLPDCGSREMFPINHYYYVSF